MKERDIYGTWCKGLVALVASVSGGVAQQGVVSPAGYENRWAATVLDNWGVSLGAYDTRTLQICTDVPALTVSEVSWRPHLLRDRSADTLECELFLGEGDFAARTPVFLDNFAGVPTRVVARRAVSWPAWSVPPVAGPRDAFLLRTPLDRPWLYTRAGDLVWMLEVHASHWGGDVDGAARLRSEDVYQGVVHGTGCQNTWNRQLARISAEGAASRALQHRLSVWCDGLRPNSPTTILVGAASVAISYPFLCGFQYVDAVVIGTLRVADIAGAIPQVDYLAPYDSNAAGLTLYAQAFCLDDGRHPMLLPVTPTNGVEVRLPAVLPVWRPSFWARDRLSSIRAEVWSTDSALVTRFR